MKEKLVFQHDETDCAAACIASVAKYYKKNISITRIRKVASTDKMGTSGLGIIKAANKLGFSCKGFLSDDKKLPKENLFPIIVHLRKSIIDHYAILYFKKNGEYLLADPDEGFKRVNKKEFDAIWSGVFFVITPTQEFSKIENSNGILSRVCSLLKPHKKTLCECFVAGILISVLGIISSFYFRYLIDDVLYSELENTLTIISLAFLFVIILSNLVSYCRNQLMMFMGNKIDLVMIRDYINHLLKLPMDFYSSRKTGEILSRLSDISVIRNIISSTTLSVIIDVCLMIFCGLFLFMSNAMLLLIAIIPVVLSSIIAWLFIKPYKERINQKAYLEAEKQSLIVETINGMSTIKSLSIEKETSEMIEDKIVQSIKKGLLLGRINNFQSSIQNFINQLGTLLVYWIGSILILKSELSLGQLISFVTLSQYFLGPFSRLINLQNVLQEALVSVNRYCEIMDIDEEKNYDESKIDIQKTINKIEIKNLSFCYGARKKALDDISLSINKGDKIAFVGLSGSGKSTLIKLLMGFYKNQTGTIIINGMNIEDVNIETFRKKVGYVPQDVLLFSGSIYENISIGKRNCSYEEVIRVAEKSQSINFINNQTNRFHTLIGEKGSTLSGGEKQRISLARVLLRNPSLLILDEATASLDGITEKQIMDNVFSLSKEITTVIVAHRLSTIVKCNKICVFENGKIVGIGTHEDLLVNNVQYQALWNSQNIYNNSDITENQKSGKEIISETKQNNYYKNKKKRKATIIA